MNPSPFELLRSLRKANDSTIVLLVMDGLGGLPAEPGGPTELEAAATPHLDQLAREGVTGLHHPVAPGITPGSGAGHLGLFGYDPLRFTIGRGALSAAGVQVDLQPGDVAARGNFCTVDDAGNVADRRAGRIDTTVNQRLCERLQGIRVDGIEVFIQPIKEHRFLLILRGEGLSPAVADTDPQQTGIPPRDPAALEPEAESTAAAVAEIIAQARDLLRAESPANMVLLRGFAARPDWPSFEEAFGLHAAAAAGYPMYRGVARLLGMDLLPIVHTLPERIDQVAARIREYDFFFVHLKETDSRGEDGDAAAKIEAIQTADEAIPALRATDPDVLIVTGDHSTPAPMKSHSWHPVPVILWSRRCRPDGVARFGERPCMSGGLGPAFPATDLLPLALAHAGRLGKYGA